ncbi:uncharacterized protein LOC132607891 [Lycium barbarum]|uniref:uncharacterized protein LOC132607891 n=1 Tax=Lycium barbarum TaxID=112863 RepID=UPI00293E2C9B|nr:uncharacterized protein LOC132607891 [Lycium barbarum]
MVKDNESVQKVVEVQDQSNNEQVKSKDKNEIELISEKEVSKEGKLTDQTDDDNNDIITTVISENDEEVDAAQQEMDDDSPDEITKGGDMSTNDKTNAHPTEEGILKEVNIAEE